MPLLSLIVPVYNTERYLDQCMASLLGQTVPKEQVQIVLVDDGSTDSSGRICDSYASDPRVEVIHKQNAGLGNARNTGIEAARGKYVAFIDSDDILEPQTYAEALRLMEETGADPMIDTVRWRCNRFTDAGESSPVSYDARPQIFDSPADIRTIALSIFDLPSPTLSHLELGGSSCMALYRRDIIEEHGIRFENEREYLSEDYLFNFDYYRHSRKVAWLDRTYYHYRITEGSLTRKLNLRVMDKVEHYCRHVESMMESRGFTEEERLAAPGFYIRALRANMRFIFLTPTLTMAEKHRWFDEQTAAPYFREHCATYPTRRLPLKQAILHKAMVRRNFPLTWLLITGFSRLRKDKLK